jgi:hypothetical protein
VGWEDQNRTAGGRWTSGSGGGGGDQVLLSIVVDAKTGQLTIKNVAEDLKSLGTAAEQTGSAAASAGNSAGTSANGWLKLYAQTQIVKDGFQAVRAVLHDTLVDTTLVAARTEVLNTTLAVTAKNMNYTTGMVQAQVNGIRKMNIAHQDAIQSTLQLMRAQLDMSKATGLARAAQDLAVISGENSSQTFEHIAEAIQTQNVWMLRQYGIVTYLDTALEQYANKLNKSAASLTNVERSQAILDLVMREAGKVQGAYVQSMEDAGKKMLSLERITKDMKEHIGSEFLPIMNKLVDAFTWLGEKIISAPGDWIRFFGALLGGSAIILASTVAVIGLAKAWQSVAAAATTAMVAQGAAASSGGVLSTLLNLGAAHPIIRAIIVAVGALTAAYVFFNKEVGAGLKTQVAANDAVLAQVQAAKNLSKEWSDISKDKKALGDGDITRAQFTERELAAHRLVSADQAKQIVFSERTVALQDRTTSALKDAKDLGAQIVQLQNNKNTGLQEEVVNVQKLAELEAQRRKEQEGAKAATQAIADLRHKELQAAVEEQTRRQQYLADAEKRTRSGSSRERRAGEAEVEIGTRSLQDQQKAVGELTKAVQQADAEVRKFTSDSDGLQRLPLTLEASLTSLTNVATMYQSAVRAQRLGVQSSEDQVKLMRDMAAGANTWVADLEKQVKLSTDIYNTQEKEGKITHAAAEAHRAEGAAIMKVANDSVAAHKTASSSIFEIGKANVAGMAAFLNTAGKPALAFAKDANTGFMNLMNQMLGAQTQFAEMAATYAGERRQVQTQLLGGLRGELQASVQTYDVRVKEVEATRAIAEIEKVSTLYQLQQLGASGKALIDMKARLEAAAAIAEATQKETIARERARGLQDLEKSSIQAQQQAYGENSAVQEKMLQTERDRAMEDVKLLYTNQELKKAQDSILDRYYAQLFALRQQTGERQAQMRLDVIRMQQQTTEAGRGQYGYQEGKVEELVALDKQRTDQEKANFANSAEYRAMRERDLSADKVDSENYLFAYQKNLDAQHAAYRRNLELEDRRMRIETATIAYQTQLQLSGLNAQAVQRKMAERDLEVQIAETARRLNLILDERTKLHDILLNQLKRQQELQKEQERVGRGRQALGGSLVDIGQQAAAAAMKDLGSASSIARDNLKQVREEYEKHKASLQELLDAQKAVQDSLLTFPEIVDVIANGFGNMLTKADVFRSTMDLVAQATGAAFNAMLSGKSAGAAFVALIGQVLKAIAVEQLVKAIKELAEGFASLAIGDPKAALHFHAAALHAAAAAAAGAAGAAAGGGGGGGGGGGAGSTGAGQQTPKPVSTKTSMEDGIIRLNENLVVNNRVVQYAGQQYDKTGAMWYQITKDIQTMSAARGETTRRESDVLAEMLARRAQHGFPQGQVDELINKMNNFIVENPAAKQQVGILEKINSNLVESTGQQQQQTSDTKSLPQQVSDKLSESLHSAQKSNNDTNQVMVGLARRQLEELVKSNQKDMTVNVDASTVLDAGSMNTLLDKNFLKNTTTHQRAIAAANAAATGQNFNRQQMGRLLGNGGI